MLQAVPHWAQQQGFAGNKRALAGAGLFASSGCLACHTYLGAGSANLGAPDLTSVGRRHGVGYFKAYVADPRRFGDQVMPKFSFTPSQLRNLATFLKASRGAR